MFFRVSMCSASKNVLQGSLLKHYKKMRRIPVEIVNIALKKFIEEFYGRMAKSFQTEVENKENSAGRLTPQYLKLATL